MHTNALIDEKSPYLRQHAHNPVNWLPWGETAFARARAEDKPIFLSIGYSTCHWCHVMAHESFENESIAAQLNRNFVPVKLDREERPDVDRVYMLFVQASTGSGGWPMSVWLTPELKPFFGGTYFPPDARYGRPGFPQILEFLSRAWTGERERIESSGTEVLKQLQSLNAAPMGTAEPSRELFVSAFPQFRRMFDSKWGGFGNAPKFPRPVAFNYLLRYYAAERTEEALDMVTQTLLQIAAGGMHDQLGGGFHRYSVDERWFVPHFEKMLYDQAQLAISYLEAYQITREKRFAEVARGIFRYVLRDLRDEGGGFYSAEDADSPEPDNPSHSGEGAFYIWDQREIMAALGEKTGELFCRRFGVRPGGNVENDPQSEFTGRNILYEATTLEEAAERSGLDRPEAAERLETAKEKLFALRNARPRPHLDNKILTSWNGLMISALARGYRVLGDRELVEAATASANFLLMAMYKPVSGQLLRRFCDGEAAVPGFLDDYAFLAHSLIDLFEITSEPEFLEVATSLATHGFAQFRDPRGGFFSTAAESPSLLLRIKDDYDGAEPAANSVATEVLLRLSHLTGNSELASQAEACLREIAPKVKAQPTAAPQMMVALGRWLAGPAQIVFRCEIATAAVEKRIREELKQFEPNIETAMVTDRSAQLLASNRFIGSLARRGALTIYRCVDFTCELPLVIEQL